MSLPNSHQDMSADTATYVRRLLDNGMHGLQFEGELESEFERYHLNRYLHLNRVYPLLGALVLVFFTFADHLVIPALFEQTLQIRAADALGIILVTLASRLAWVRNRYQMTLCLGALCIHLSLIAIAVKAAAIDQFHYQTGSIISVIFVCTVLRLQFHYIFPFALLMWLSQVLAMHFLMHLHASQFTELLFLHTFVTLISVLVCYRVEYETRKNFLQQLLLLYEQEELRAAHAELERLSLMDSLTQVANRRHFNRSLEAEWNRCLRDDKSLALLMVDVDFFKAYNDAYGHQRGDDCLINVADCLTQTSRRAADLVARYGGEEFAVILPHADQTSAQRVAEQIVRQIYELNMENEGSPELKRLTVSVGFSALAPSQDDSPNTLISQADSALYMAKRKGKNRAHGFPANEASETAEPAISEGEGEPDIHDESKSNGEI
ncbi:GGDEF domain-containing protein [Hahella aquimaris]|uniref:GGDEF domain-containing protein n=1 Tax=Hahella sp. HNIBRBA332 TaxID=3015983 RepID=UPI00273BE9EF|nr:GGDEF domain-containing protein [Hahella sp. HNIBRBA332]WLQ15111.1 GGDEF domain-containing protein [Hahella sp. HNIBRBA332]